MTGNPRKAGLSSDMEQWKYMADLFSRLYFHHGCRMWYLLTIQLLVLFLTEVGVDFQSENRIILPGKRKKGRILTA